ncbi:DNA repair protein rhp7 isoform X1 [Asparagus officinalis]|nr:DNA repair protein rhp7 isoform X1 [Asparagus officinalis]XP_020269958.1 DNA repair protein rhp7 isoform X1 [Asparagus officinalis]XP_020269959.1 DNA repair protein rhp7 isoform X1 [Asparagus officinalis]
MNLRSSPRFAKRQPIVEVDLNKRLDGGEKSQLEENGEVSEAVSVEKSKDKMVIDDDEEGKGKLVVEEGQSSIYNNEVTQSSAREVFEGGRSRRRVKTRMAKESRKESGRKVALELAPKYAFFKADEESSEEEEEEDLAVNADQNEDWPGPFSTAMKIIRDREQILIARELNSSSKKNDDAGVKIQWSPSKDKKVKTFGKSPPSLHDLCMKVLCDNAEEVESLYGVPDAIKHRFVSHLCRSRKMGSRVLGLLVSGSPTEIHLSDCSWGTEGEFEEAFGGCNTEKLKVLELNISGRCLPDYVLRGILARSIKNLPLLTKISFRGNYRLSDDGLNAIVSSAPSLSCINLSQCSLISSAGIINVAEKLESVLKELYIDECQDVDAMLILPSLMKLKNLEVLSVAEIETVSNKFVRKLVSSCGSTIKELGLSGCRKLTAGSMKVIGESCSLLRSLDLRNLNRLNDLAIGYLANGCRSIQKLKLRRNAFSDEALAAFLEASGGSLIELSVNNFAKVGQQTAIAISRRCSSTLKTLDLSFCRNMSDEALGLIVDSCSNLQILKLFGCTQVTNVFMEGHSNPAIQIVGSKGPVLDRIQLPEYL